MAKTDKRYNGWKNRATWNAALWLGNGDEGTYRAARDMVRSHKRADQATAIRDFCFEIWGTKTPDGDSLHDVAWRDVANSLAE